MSRSVSSAPAAAIDHFPALSINCRMIAKIEMGETACCKSSQSLAALPLLRTRRQKAVHDHRDKLQLHSFHSPSLAKPSDAYLRPRRERWLVERLSRLYRRRSV